MKLYLIFIVLLISSCQKAVYTEYFEKENFSLFTTHPLVLGIPNDRFIEVTASRRCPGKNLCEAKEIKLILRLETKFSFLEGKDFRISVDRKILDLNRRRYTFNYDSLSIYKDGTTGFALERFVLWLKANEFSEIIKGQEISFIIGKYDLPIKKEDTEKWRILTDNNKLLLTLNEEDQRTYGEYSEAPISEVQVREKFEKKASIQAEELTWEMVKDSENPKDLEFFLEQYPNSPYSKPVLLKLNQLKRLNK